MGGLIILLGLGWLAWQFIKDASIKPCPPGTDHTAALSDCYKNNLSKKEFNRRIDSGYYVKKQENEQKLFYNELDFMMKKFSFDNNKLKVRSYIYNGRVWVKIKFTECNKEFFMPEAEFEKKYGKVVNYI